MGIKSLTGSRNIADLNNRLGHCASYSTIDEVKTKLTFEATKEKRLTSNKMSLNPANNIGLAFDNTGRYNETVSGKYTLHDTVGIAYETSLKRVRIFKQKLVCMLKKKVFGNWVGYRALQLEIENFILWHDTTK